LSRDDIEYYVAHRLRIAGFTGSRLFSRSAIAALYAASGGIPRLINILAHKALMLGYGEGKQRVSRHHVNVAARDTLASKGRYRRWPIFVALAVAAAGFMDWVFRK
jgi:MSHA biogenesis protein MshM